MIKKKLLKSKPVCKVSFKIPAEVAGEAQKAHLVGDFNDWQQTNPMKKLKDKSFSLTLDLETGKEYQFRYLLDGEKWENDPEADKFETTPFGDSENSVIAL